MTHGFPQRGGSAVWRFAFLAAYRLIRLMDPALRPAWRANLAGLGRTVDLVVVGRRSGRPRGTLLTLLSIEDTWYVGHPNGPSGWTRNLEAAGSAEVRMSDGGSRSVAAIRLLDGPERDRVVSLTPVQQPFPGNVLYALAQRHIHAVGAYFRLEPREPA
jgi:deazaflavin-dependent oxidoreductase (nitroreductase family)